MYDQEKIRFEKANHMYNQEKIRFEKANHLYYHEKNVSEQLRQHIETNCNIIGDTFPTQLDSDNVKLKGCKEDGELKLLDVCCINDYGSRGIGSELQESDRKYSESSPSVFEGTKCYESRRYFPSSYELQQRYMAKKLSNITDSKVRKEMLLDFLTSTVEVNNSIAWLKTIREQMSSFQVPEIITPNVDKLCYFQVERRCHNANGNGSSVESIYTWKEWIEPLNVILRHPFALSRGYVTGFEDVYARFQSFTPSQFQRNISSPDHILLQSALSHYNHSRLGYKKNGTGIRNKHYLLDAGTSTFRSSLMFLICAYSQRKISFNAVFGWEKTHLNPREYWSNVPRNMLPYIHFFNTPINPGMNDHNSPLQLLKEIATEDDFVAFKLDVDNADVELPIIHAILRNEHSIARKIDELFVEVHFECDLMSQLGFPSGNIFDPVTKKRLRRDYAFDIFFDLRKMGIRAHVWP